MWSTTPHARTHLNDAMTQQLGRIKKNVAQKAATNFTSRYKLSQFYGADTLSHDIVGEK